VICQYVNVEQAALDGVYRIAEAKFIAALKKTGICESPGSLLTSTAQKPGDMQWRATELVARHAS
jgi:hypothetical protein